MNKVILIGRLTKDPEIKNTSSQVPLCNFTIAVDRRFKDQSGQRQSDFISCVAWRQTATFISSYFHKGNKIAVVGSIQTRSYDDNQGQKRYVTEVLVDEAEFVESRGESNGSYSRAPETRNDEATFEASAPVAPRTPIAPDIDSDDGSDVELPFEF